jgi:hypothetical protein
MPNREALAQYRATGAMAGIALDRGIFRAYDIRGLVGVTLDANIARLIGQAVGSLMHEKNQRSIVVGRDGRLSSGSMAAGPDRRPAQGRARSHRHRRSAHADGLLRHLPPAHRLLRLGHRQPQSSGLQRLQDRGRRRDAVRRRDPEPVCAHRRKPAAPRR